MDPLIQFGVFSDAHSGHGVVGDRHQGDSLLKLRDCIAIFNRRRLSLAFNMGDLVDRAPDDAPGAEARYLEAAGPVLFRFNGTWHHVIGNHDVAGMTKAEFMQTIGFRGPRSFYAFDAGPVHCIVLDGNYNEDGSDFSPAANDWTRAWMAPNELAWLRQDLAAAQGRPVIVFIHENIDDRVVDGSFDPHLLRNTDQVRPVIEASGNVQAVIQGHYHVGLCTVLNGIPYFGATAMATGPGVDNNAFAIVSLYPNRRLSVEGFGRQVSWVSPESPPCPT